MPRALPPLALLAALALALAGCTSASKGVAPEPTAVAAPFASEEEALAAAVEAYARFVEVGSTVGYDGGQGAERLELVATGEFLENSIAGFESWIAKGWKQVGTNTFRDAVLQQYSKGPEAAVILYLCDDISAVDVVDESGQSVAADGRPDTNYFQVTFDLGQDQVLRVSGRQRWDDRAC